MGEPIDDGLAQTNGIPLGGNLLELTVVRVIGDLIDVQPVQQAIPGHACANVSPGAVAVLKGAEYSDAEPGMNRSPGYTGDSLWELACLRWRWFSGKIID